jgi:hypothetical protein
MKAMLMALLFTVGACALDVGGDEDLELAISEQENGGSSFTNHCYYSGSTYWCEDRFQKQWCTNATTTTDVWDSNTGCNWDGWHPDHPLYCIRSGQYAGWMYSTFITHRHCP